MQKCDSKNSLLSLAHVNAQSIRNKALRLVDYVKDNQIDICAITETWLTDIDNAARSELNQQGFILRDKPRPSGRKGGGTGLLCRDNIKVKLCKTDEQKSFEVTEWSVSLKNETVKLVVVYRPPYSPQSQCTVADFLMEFDNYLETLVNSKETIIMTGDYNIHVNKKELPESEQFLDLIHTYGFVQHVNTPTHTSGNTLDLLMSRETDPICLTSVTTDHLFSDHFVICCKIGRVKPEHTVRKVQSRKIADIDIDKFKESIRTKTSSVDGVKDVNKLVEIYNTSLKSTLDEMAPIKEREVTIRPKLPWFKSEHRELKQKLRKAERVYKRTKQDTDLLKYKDTRNEYVFELKNARSQYYNEKIMLAGHNQKELYSMVNGLLNRTKSNTLPDEQSDQSLAEAFNGYFLEKIRVIREQLDGVECDPIPVETGMPVHELSSFKTLEEDDVKKLILGAKPKQCILDPAPTALVKQCLDVLTPLVTQIVNTSIENGVFPDEWKTSVITPLLKKEGLSPDYKNYRPINNLPFLSKITEKIVVAQLNEYLNEHDMLPKFQSAYRAHHSTETALIRFKSDLLMAMDAQKVTLVVMLDLSAAFDTVDHPILLEALRSQYGISDVAHKWFESYLSHRNQSVCVNGERSNEKAVSFSVPQGSCCGPILFTLYAASIFSIVHKHALEAGGYADDHRIMLSFKITDSTSEIMAIERMEKCLQDIRTWMIQHKLKMNDDKSEVIFFGTRQQRAKLVTNTVSVGGIPVKAVECVRDLGAWLDCNLDMKTHVVKKCRAAYINLYNINRIRNMLTNESAEGLVHSLVHSHIDYCNGLLAGMPSTLIDSVQRVQNFAARVVTQADKYAHITPILSALHWLPVKMRIRYKILVLVHNSIHGKAPKYLQELTVIRSSSTYELRINDSQSLDFPVVTCSTLGERAFARLGPCWWNKLPCELRQISDYAKFIKNLKTYLFCQ